MEYLGRTSRWLCCQAKSSHEPRGVHFMQPQANYKLQHFLWKCIKNDRNMVFTVLSHSTCILRPFTRDGTKCGAWFCGTSRLDKLCFEAVHLIKFIHVALHFLKYTVSMRNHHHRTRKYPHKLFLHFTKCTEVRTSYHKNRNPLTK